MRAEMMPDRNDMLRGYRSWLHAVARRVAPFEGMVEDLAQEGYIAMWRALGKWDPAIGEIDPFIKACAERRMVAMLSDETKWTGQVEPGVKTQSSFAKKGGDEMRARIREVQRVSPGISARQIAIVLGVNNTTVLKHLKRMHMSAEAKPLAETSLEEFVASNGDDFAFAVRVADALEMAYHHGEIMTAISELNEDERKYVVLRFWLDKTEPEIQPYVRSNVVSIWRGTGGARDKLRARLARLEDAA